MQRPLETAIPYRTLSTPGDYSVARWIEIGGPLVALAFLKLQLFGAWISAWGPWNDFFIALGADTLSWWVLGLTAVVEILVGLAGALGLSLWLGQRIRDGELVPRA